MSKKIRDYLFIVFIILFVLGTILISLYASGFQINFTGPLNFNRLLLRTGIVAIKTKPEGATIYLNNKPQSDFSINPWRKKYLVTATMLKNILPGKYNLSLRLKGYLPLTKKITVHSGQTTFVEHINLFRSDLPQLIATSSESTLQLSFSHKYLYLSAKAEIMTIATGQVKKLKLPVNSKGIWLKNNNQLFAAGYLFNSDANINLNYRKILGKSAHNFYYDENQNRLYYQTASALSYLELNKQTSILATRGENYLTYEPRANKLFLVVNKNGQTLLQVYSLKTRKIEQTTNLPRVGHYLFVPENHSYLTLYDEQNKTLYLINPANINNDKKIIHNVVSWQWLNDQTIFYSNNWEIYQLNIPKNNNTLLTRVGEKISKIVWNKNNNYLIFSTANSINAYDPKIGIITKIFKTDKIADINLDDTNNTLYFWGKIGRQSGIYSILLQ